MLFSTKRLEDATDGEEDGIHTFWTFLACEELVLIADTEGDALANGYLNLDACSNQIVMVRVDSSICCSGASMLVEVHQRGGDVRRDVIDFVSVLYGQVIAESSRNAPRVDGTINMVEWFVVFE